MVRGFEERVEHQVAEAEACGEERTICLLGDYAPAIAEIQRVIQRGQCRRAINAGFNGVALRIAAARLRQSSAGIERGQPRQR